MSAKLDRHGRPKPGKSSHGKQLEKGRTTKKVEVAPGPSFLFVVSEYKLNYQNIIPRDEWQNVLPPQSREEYVDETSSTVMRFSNGRITPASRPGVKYSWVRDEQTGRGGICRSTSDGFVFMPDYKSASVFACNPLLPIVYARDDYSINMNPLHALHFERDDAVSRITYSDDFQSHAPPTKFAAGREASWIPSLVPASYKNPYGTVVSRGLGGELAVVLGLMAFHAANPNYHALRAGRTIDQVFLGRSEENGGLWRDWHWRGTHPGIYPASTQESPRGFLTHICLDDENYQGSTEETISLLEWRSILVRG